MRERKMIPQLLNTLLNETKLTPPLAKALDVSSRTVSEPRVKLSWVFQLLAPQSRDDEEGAFDFSQHGEV